MDFGRYIGFDGWPFCSVLRITRPRRSVENEIGLPMPASEGSMLRATDFAHAVLQRVIRAGDWVVDATVGNGYDTALLAALVGASGRVFGFDVQAVAIAAATVRVAGLAHVELFHCGHERMAECLPVKARGHLSAVMFNLGYLPGGNRDVVTRAETTVAALRQALDFLRPGGMVTVVLYPGHPAGADEAGGVRDFARQLPAAFAVTHAARMNALRSAPELVMIERRV
jgi:predicted methyltransferase